MPPEILGGFFDKESTHNYDGTKADIYSAGVMLCVLILRSMVRGREAGLGKGAGWGAKQHRRQTHTLWLRFEVASGELAV